MLSKIIFGFALLGSLALLAWFWLAGPPTDQASHAAMVELSPKERLGKDIFFDPTLSTPPGQPCSECHAPDHGFTNLADELPVSRGIHPDRFGNRNDMPAAYAGFGPPLHFDAKEGAYVGGNFWDGRANNLVEQAKGPFLNPLEMANPDEAAVVAKLRQAPYAPMFRRVFGEKSLEDVKQAYHFAAEAIAAYEMSAEVNRFDSKFDFYLKGQAVLSTSEKLGLEVFNDPKKGNCAACHPSTPGPGGAPPLFTDFTYDNLGVPKNPVNPFYYLPPAFNPAGVGYVDPGLGEVVKKPSENGKFRVPSLRNVALTKPYMHNGVFQSLRDVVMFYNTRDTGPWPAPEVAENVNREELGNLKLTVAEIDALVIFMHTLTDGHRPAAVSPPAR